LTYNINLKPIKPKRVVVFGRTGFIAASVIKKLKKRNISVVSFSKSEIDLIKKNSIKKISKILKNEDSVLFIAAKAPVKNEKMLLENFFMLENFLIGLKNKKLSHFIYVSSDAVYSDSKILINEQSKTIPNSLHGIMHLTRENIFKVLIKTPICIVRSTLIYGNKDPHNGYGPNRFARLALKNDKIYLFGKGEELRDHIHIDDVTEIILNVILYKTIGVINACTGKVFSFYNIAKIIVRALKSKSKIISTKRVKPMPHDGYRAFNNSILKKVFPKIKLKLLNKEKLFNSYK